MHKEIKKELEKRVVKFLTWLKTEMYEENIPLQAKYSEFTEWVPFEKRETLEYKNIKEGDTWGHPWNSAWFHVTGKVPASWKGKTVAARLQFEGELLIFDEKGMPQYALTNASVWDLEYVKNRIIISECAKGGEEVSFWVEAACNGIFGLPIGPDPQRNDPNRHGVFNGVIRELKLSLFNKKLYALMLDIEVLNSMVEVLEKGIPRREKILRALNKLIDVFGYEIQNVDKALAITKELLSKKNGDSAMSVSCIGHAHLDTGWLWPVKESIRKAARTFAHQFDLIDRYPGYIFGASQPQHFQFIKDHYPMLYDKLKKYVKAGTFELQGGMWVEADCNLISGESMIRQVLHGKNFFMDEFGEDVKNLWLPDVFGYSAAMPQILSKSGIDTFMTQKISWNQFNAFPHHTFIWEGNDGSEILTHFLPTNTYNAVNTPKELINAERRFVENDVLEEFLSLFGIGDGGGGPKDDQIERAIRMKDLEGVPKVRMEPAKDYFKRLHTKKHLLEKWVGELYLELHRGTLTTQSKVKRDNRRLERTLISLEQIASLLPYDKYPKAVLDKIYKILLINQFHDIIPGSSIKKVYENTHKEYAECFAATDKLKESIAVELFAKDDNAITLYNTLSFDYEAEIFLGTEWAGYEIGDGNKVTPSQDTLNGVVIKVSLKPFEFKTLYKGDKNHHQVELSGSFTLENDKVKYVFDKNGQITEGYDKEFNKLFLTKGNVLSLYVDRVNDWDAWDVDIMYENCKAEEAKCVKAYPKVSGDVFNGLKFEYEISSSKIVQHIHLSHGSKELQVHTHVNWNEFHKMLRMSMDTTIKSDTAAFDIQYSYVKRPTHRNTSWDMAKFETVAHKYVDISDLNYGVALLNNCKYGHKVLGSTIDLNLMRAPTVPDPDADLGNHDIMTVIYPHANQLAMSEVYEAGTKLNAKPVVFHGYKMKGDLSQFVEVVERNGVTLEIIKHAEKEDKHVVRFVETKGMNGSIKLRFKKETELIETNLIEWKNGNTQKVHEVELFFKPFEIKTFKFSV
ncbi:MAG: glycoside hydrolase family 38 C-terminal domain-containing protein [Lentisphaerota bacterium]